MALTTYLRHTLTNRLPKTPERPTLRSKPRGAEALTDASAVSAGSIRPREGARGPLIATQPPLSLSPDAHRRSRSFPPVPHCLPLPYPSFHAPRRPSSPPHLTTSAPPLTCAAYATSQAPLPPPSCHTPHTHRGGAGRAVRARREHSGFREIRAAGPRVPAGPGCPPAWTPVFSDPPLLPRSGTPALRATSSTHYVSAHSTRALGRHIHTSPALNAQCARQPPVSTKTPTHLIPSSDNRARHPAPTSASLPAIPLGIHPTRAGRRLACSGRSCTSRRVGLGADEGALPAVELGVGVCGALGCGVTLAPSSRVTSSPVVGGSDTGGSRHVDPGGTTKAILSWRWSVYSIDDHRRGGSHCNFTLLATASLSLSDLTTYNPQSHGGGRGRRQVQSRASEVTCQSGGHGRGCWAARHTPSLEHCAVYTGRAALQPGGWRAGRAARGRGRATGPRGRDPARPGHPLVAARQVPSEPARRPASELLSSLICG
ncbi:hypothetical protein C7M84_003645 [Penaeus vannamei]|uniref:Uncharacterized protein n=1 Tax=Penaeus vannamei TaxID=6689 RepID=A0A423TMJ7_PENVA|nr:hypothetical protein C7M84_003645 [Penaeus vannamei]